jgi:redox-sensitive bicupin YhaK (pirin superfamily)
MFTVRKGSDRGVTKFGGWLDSRHTFSFGDYQDPKHHQFRALRVINDDRVAPGGGFPTHPHRDMEILTCVLSGKLEHRDSMGNGEVIHAGEWQAMTAGTGITHSEFNPSKSEPVHLLQIWLFPDKRGHTPGYQQKVFTDTDKRGKLVLVASPNGEAGSLVIHQDARVYQTKLAGETVRYELAPGRAAFVHVATGNATVNGTKLAAGDAVAAEDEKELTVSGDGDVLLFDLA